MGNERRNLDENLDDHGPNYLKTKSFNSKYLKYGIALLIITIFLLLLLYDNFNNNKIEFDSNFEFDDLTDFDLNLNSKDNVQNDKRSNNKEQKKNKTKE